MKIKEAEGEVSLFHELPEFYGENVKNSMLQALYQA